MHTGNKLDQQPESTLLTVSVRGEIPKVALVEVVGEGSAKCLNQDFIFQLFNIQRSVFATF